MTTNPYTALLAVSALTLALAACSADPAANASVSTPQPLASAANDGVPSDSRAKSTDIPPGFSSYASESIGDNKQCVVGAAVDDDGMNQRPVAYVAETSGKALWTRTLELPRQTYQSRATHCVREADSVYVLLQSDTQPQQASSQTLLRVVRLALGDGVVQGQADVPVPGVKDPVSAWVEEGAQGLRWSNGGLIVSGQYYRLDDSDRRNTFQVGLKPDLKS